MFNEELHKEKFKSKIDSLFKEREDSLGIRVVEKQFDERKHLHVLCKNMHNDSFIVWSSFYIGNDPRTYDAFYNGKYDLNLKEGMRELERRSGLNQELVNQLLKELAVKVADESDLNFLEKDVNSALLSDDVYKNLERVMADANYAGDYQAGELSFLLKWHNEGKDVREITKDMLSKLENDSAKEKNVAKQNNRNKDFMLER